MKDREKWLQKATVRANLPGESIPGTSLVELFGDKRVLIENHCGVAGYSDGMICVRCNCGQIQIEGAELRIAHMTKQQLVILGNVHSICFNKGS